MMAAMTAKTAITPSPSSTWFDISDLDLDDAAQPERANAHQHDHHDEHGDAERVGEQRPDICGAHQDEVGGKDRRQATENPGREAPLGRQPADLTAQPFAF